MHREWITAVCLGLGLSASCGFRVFVPMLVASVAGKLGYLPLHDEFLWLSSWPAIICFASASFFEILAYYIPFFDNFLDSITTPLAILAGTVMATSILPVDQDLWKWVSGFIIGGGSAATVQTGMGFLRLMSSKTSAGMGNKYLATGENAASFSTPILSMLMPFTIGILTIALVIVIITMLFRTAARNNKNNNKY
ncbi:MAG: DUF4126 domain-containing protein [Bacteroidetes bacterium]|nr:MAG: DUF4126 domain-containing protein [Bacteroidota bacterium]